MPNGIPVLLVQEPTCSNCWVDCVSEADGWVCPTCGTWWDYEADDGTQGELFPVWSGEDYDGD